MPRGTREPSEVFRDVLDQAAKALSLSSDKAKNFRHNSIRGGERAGALASFLREHLPSTLGVGKGEAIDFKDKRTGELDLVVYDRAGSAPIEVGTESLLLPCESLYVVVEVKTTLTQEELDKSYVHAKKVRALRPFKKRFVGPGDGGPAPKDGNPRCLYVIFAYDTNLGREDWLTKEHERIKLAARRAQCHVDCVDRVVVLDRGMISPSDARGKVVENDGESIFLEVYLHIVNFINRERRRRPPVDWQVYGPRSNPGWVKLNR